MPRLARSLSLLVVVTLGGAHAQAQWSAGSPLSQPRGRVTTVALDDLVLFAAGEDPSSGVNFDVVDIYDASLGPPSNKAAWSQTQLSVARTRLAGTAVGHLALFAGGGIDALTPLDVVDVYDTQTKSWSLAVPLTEARSQFVATTVGSLALFAGGTAASGVSDRVDIYDASKGSPSDPAAWSTWKLTQARVVLAAAAVGNKAIFAGGGDPAPPGAIFDTVDIYDASVGPPSDPAAWSQASLSQPRLDPAVAAVGTRAYIAGGLMGQGPGSASDVIDIFDAATGFLPRMTLPEPRFGLQATAVGNTVVFAGGGDNAGAIAPTVHRLNVGTGLWDSSRQLSLGAYGMGVATVAGRALFAGGMWEPLPNSQVTDRVEVYDPVGINDCVATPNSSGCAATISASGSASLAANNLALTTVCVPNGVFLYFHGSVQQQTPFGDGFRCAGGNILRILPAAVASGGVAQVSVDLPAAKITAPGVRHFQCWFRDPAAGGTGSNTSDSISIAFVP